jgi:carbamoyltransferase
MLRVRKFKDGQADKVPAVVHVDGTGRLQTLDHTSNGSFYELVDAFYRRTGVPILLNTSFNGPCEPIVETPTDALRCMLANGLDACVFPGLIAVGM